MGGARPNDGNPDQLGHNHESQIAATWHDRCRTFSVEALRSKKINGHRFRRQHPIGQYIADFACIEQRIVIELDGGQHQEQNIYDEQRSVCLQAQGWRVLRFWNNEVLNNIDGVLTVIAENLTGAPPS